MATEAMMMILHEVERGLPDGACPRGDEAGEGAVKGTQKVDVPDGFVPPMDDGVFPASVAAWGMVSGFGSSRVLSSPRRFHLKQTRISSFSLGQAEAIEEAPQEISWSETRTTLGPPTGV